MSENNSKNTILGIDENIEALLCYAIGWASGLVFLLLEKQSQFVRFHALQSLVTFLGLQIVSIAAFMVPFVGVLIGFLIWPVGLILWIVLMIKAYQREKFKLPVIGDFVEKQLAR